MALPADPGGTTTTQSQGGDALPSNSGGVTYTGYVSPDGPYGHVYPAGTLYSVGSNGSVSADYTPPKASSGATSVSVSLNPNSTSAFSYRNMPDGSVWLVNELDPSRNQMISGPTAGVNPADKNNDGLDDSTNMALGVYASKLSWTGYAYGAGVPVWPNGAPAGENPNPETVQAPKAGTWTGYGPKGQGTYYLDGPGGTPGTYLGPTTQAGAGLSGGGSSGGGGGGGTTTTHAGGFTNTSTSISEYGPERVAIEQALIELEREKAAAKNETDIAIAEMNFAVNMRRLGLDERKFGVDAAETFGRLASGTDPLAFAAFLHAGGGNIMNALNSGADALSPAALLPAARALQAMRGLGGTPTGGTPTGSTPGSPGSSPTPGSAGGTPTPGAPPADNPFVDEEGRQIRQYSSTNALPNYNPNLSVMGPTAEGLGGYGDTWRDLTGNTANSMGNNITPYSEPPPGYVWNPTKGYYEASGTGTPAVPGGNILQGPPTTGTGTNFDAPPGPLSSSLSTAVGGISAATGQIIGGATPPPNDTPNASWNGSAWVMPDGTPAPTTLTNKATVPMYAQGTMRGLVRHPMMVTGDSPSQNPTANGARPEVIVNPTNAPLGVIPFPQARQMMRGLSTPPPRFAYGTDPSPYLTGGYYAPDASTDQYGNPIPNANGVLYEYAPNSLGPINVGETGAYDPAVYGGGVTSGGGTRQRIPYGNDSIAQPAPTTQPTTTTATTNTATPTTLPATSVSNPAMNTQIADVGPPPMAGLPSTPTVGDVGTPPPPGTTPPGTTPPTGTIGGNVPGSGYGVTPLTPDQLGVTGNDIPSMWEVLGLRQGTQVPNLNYYDIGFNDLPPTLQQLYFSGLQGKYGIPQQDSVDQWGRYRMRGLSGGNLSLAV